MLTLKVLNIVNRRKLGWTLLNFFMPTVPSTRPLPRKTLPEPCFAWCDMEK